MASRSETRAHLLQKLAWAAVSNPIVFFYLFRWLTLFLAAALVLLQAIPNANRRYEPGLLLFEAFLLTLGATYTAFLHPMIAPERAKFGHALPADLLVMGIADMALNLAVLLWSGGLGTPFFHVIVTSLLVPCFLLPVGWGLSLAALYGGLYFSVVAVANQVVGGAAGLDAPGAHGQITRDIASLLFIAGAVTYLGSVFRSLQAERRRTKEALDETQLMFTVTQGVAQGEGETLGLALRLAQVMRNAGVFAQWSLFLPSAGGKLELASSTAGVEALNTRLAEQAARECRAVSQWDGDARRWQVAAPLKVGGEVLGVMLVGSSGEQGESKKLLPLSEAIASQIAIGLQNALLAQQKAELAAQEERSRIAREIHDGVAQSIYILSLQLETCAELASQGLQDLGVRLEELVGLSKQALLEVRHYIFDLKPYLAGEQTVAAMVSSQVNEFTKVSGIPVSFALSGEPRHLPVAGAAALYRVTQEALANVFRHAKAASAKVSLEFRPENTVLTITDDGNGFASGDQATGHGLGNMQHRAESLGGAFALRSAPGQGTEVRITLPF